LDRLGDTRVDFIKLDVQGYELACLKGAKAALESAAGVEVEVEFQELYAGQPLFPDVDHFLRSAGFVLFGLRRSHWRRRSTWCPGQLIFADALYLKDPIAAPRQLNVDNLICTAVLYDRFDYAMELVDRFGDVIESREALKQALLARSSPQNRRFRLPLRLAGLFEEMAFRIRRSRPPAVHYTLDSEF
jgi:hypothetical protein